MLDMSRILPFHPFWSILMQALELSGVRVLLSSGTYLIPPPVDDRLTFEDANRQTDSLLPGVISSSEMRLFAIFF